MIVDRLSQISTPIKSELVEFNEKFKAKLKSKIGLVDLITSYMLKQKGKRIRPLLVLLTAKTAGGINERSYRGAILVELLHTATLVHDDVVDNVDKRRGFPSLNAIWKNKISVLMGEYLLYRGLNIAVEGKDYDFLEILTDTIKGIAEGELLQIQKTRKLDIDEKTYFKVISDKTASLFETCCQIGVASATENTELRRAMKNFGEFVGLAFQIKDDILDYEGSSYLFGKPIGGDIKEKKITLPLIYALNKVSNNEANRIKSLIKNGRKKEAVGPVIDFVHKNGGIEYAENIAQQYAQKAKQCLLNFPESDSRKSLFELVEFVINRKR